LNSGYVYKYNKNNHSLTLSGVEHFKTADTFLCGQCFRWDREDDGSFTGVAMGKVINIRETEDGLVLSNCDEDDFLNVWRPYLDLDTDYGAIKKVLSADAHLKKAAEFGGGIRILNQDPFECLISYIISTQNNIPRIKKIINTLCRMYGEVISFGDREYHTFPDCTTIASLTESDLSPLNAGYRVPYIIDGAKKVASGEIELNKLFAMTTSSARDELMKIKGVGPKVADCTLLFSLKKRDAFPVDVWMQKIMRSLYLGESATLKEISAFGAEKFGELSGIAQQYLFYYARENAFNQEN